MRPRPRRALRSLASCTLVGVVLLGACSSDDADDDAADSTTTAPPTTAPVTLPLPDLPAAPAAADPADQTPPVGTNGITIDAEGLLWIADGDGNQVLQADPTTGEILQRWPAPDGAWPDDVAIDDQGRVFWTGFQSGEIGRIDPELDEHVIVSTVPPGANPIAFSDDGRLFVGLAVTAEGLYEIDPSGRDEPRLMTDESGNVNGFDVGEDGYIYGPRATTMGEVVQLDTESGAVIATIFNGIGFGTAVRQAPNGDLYVLAANPAFELWRLKLDEPDALRNGLTLDTQIADNFAIWAPDGGSDDDTTTTSGDDGTTTTTEPQPPDYTFYVTTFDRPVVLVVAPDRTQTELPIGSEG